MSNGNSGNYKTTISKIYLNISDVFVDQAKALRSPTFLVKPATIRVYPDHTIRLKKILWDYSAYFFYKCISLHTHFCPFCIEGIVQQPSTYIFLYSRTSKDQYNYITVTVICTPIQYFWRNCDLWVSIHFHRSKYVVVLQYFLQSYKSSVMKSAT